MMKAFGGQVRAAVLCVASAAEGADKACDKWDIFTDLGLFEGVVRKAEKGFAADENGIRVETEEKAGAAGVTHRRTVVRNLAKKPLAATCLHDVFRFEGGDFEVYTQANTNLMPKYKTIEIVCKETDWYGRVLFHSGDITRTVYFDARPKRKQNEKATHNWRGDVCRDCHGGGAD